ncbi:MAG: YfcC family protein [Vicinamibacterales bacterium]
MRVRLPHPFVLLLGGVVVAAALTWMIPAGHYHRQLDAATGREVVVPGTYELVEAAPVGPMDALLAVPRGIVAGADVILVVLFVGGTFAFLESTGALGRLLAGLVGGRLPPPAIVVVVSLVFATLGALENMGEEIVALIPILLILSRNLGYGAVTAVAMSAGAAIVGSAFGPTNPFQTAVALRLAELPAMSQPALRFVMLGASVTIWIAWTLFMARRDDVRPEVASLPADGPTRRDGVLLMIAVLPFVPYVYGVLALDWGFNELSGLFLLAGLAIGLVSGLSLSESAVRFLKSMEGMLAAGLFIGVARAISIALADGQILDTILHALATPLAETSGVVSVLLMVPAQAVLHVPVVSVSGQAVLTMPIMAPLADLIGVSRDAVVIAYQTGAGLCEMITPTNGGHMAVLLGAQLPWGRWLRFAIPGALLVSIVGVIGILLAA